MDWEWLQRWKDLGLQQSNAFRGSPKPLFGLWHQDQDLNKCNRDSQVLWGHGRGVYWILVWYLLQLREAGDDYMFFGFLVSIIHIVKQSYFQSLTFSPMPRIVGPRQCFESHGLSLIHWLLAQHNWSSPGHISTNLLSWIFRPQAAGGARGSVRSIEWWLGGWETRPYY